MFSYIMKCPLFIDSYIYMSFIALVNKRNVLIKKEHNEVDAVQHETILNHTHSSITKNSLFEVNKRNVLIKKEHNEVDAVQHETILNHTQSSITENSSFEG
ncbi:hypothetical protein Smp_152420 [Schistosoma mansoni]|uniref:hypothetical protein n=1 Tax=Schistosoma mansoni TaxID=6183 RepID=UPI00022C8779|nr:hypothetical protein Smp_152420 [Schistosoma mansoni]|eukprot:XP_018646285.1 hypothetical protein Smp_152420 [Schistosoma mansoni]